MGRANLILSFDLAEKAKYCFYGIISYQFFTNGISDVSNLKRGLNIFYPSLESNAR